MISKGNLKEQIRMMPLREDPCEVPRSIIDWVKDPRMDFGWSKLILKELEEKGVEVVTPY